MTGLFNRIMDYLGDRLASPVDGTPGEINYTTLSASAGWIAPSTALGVFSMSPSNTSVAYAYLRNETLNRVAAYLTTTAGMGASTTAPIIKGHKYRVYSASSNVASNGRCTLHTYKLMGGGTS